MSEKSEAVGVDRGLETAASKLKNLGDYERRLERAARRVDEEMSEHDQASLVIYEAALMQGEWPRDEVREMVREFRRTYDDPEEELTIPRVSGLMNAEGPEWFFGDEGLRRLAGRLLGQFQHRVAQYNYLEEREVLRRWADSYDTRLFIRRRIYGTEPVVGVVSGFDLPRVQFLRVAAGGNTLEPTPEVSGALSALGLTMTDEYETLAAGEGVALILDLPAPVVGAMLEDLYREGVTDFPEPAREEETPVEPDPGETEGAD
ncbi:hypothetical protein [Rubrobacter aplysinae]|uniref:hypothetical protein n=1 Tax=Rubrobacter aplysinae TaxID=909625 RepID=UPI00064C2052|nr:hypothetical protein [Rubrobacter aplysinae]